MARSTDFEALLERYARVMSSAIRRVCGRRYGALIPDVQQEVRLSLWKRLQQPEAIRHPSSYLYKMALTTALAHVRKIAAEVPAETDVLERVEARTVDDDARRLLEQLLDRLDPEPQKAVRAYLAGFNHEEVGRLFGWTPSRARHLIYRSIDRLRRQMRTGEEPRMGGGDPAR